MDIQGAGHTASSGLTWRAFAVGLLGCLAIGLGVQYGEMITGGSRMASGFDTGAALFLFFFVGVLNTSLKFFHPGWALKRAELVVIYAMMMVACALPTTGLVAYHLPIMVHSLYFATPENDWIHLIHPHIARWMAPQGPEAIKYFFEGLPSGETIPWGAWVIPLACWGLFFAALYLVMVSTTVILRKQWIEREQLIYPVVHVPLAMVQEDDRNSAFPPFFKSGLMWFGFFIPVLVTSCAALYQYYPAFPSMKNFLYPGVSVPILRNMTEIRFMVSFPILGFSYLIKLDIAFSLWFFNLVANVLLGVFRVIGVESNEHLDFAANSPTLAHQGMGAMIVLGLGGLWMAREHLKNVLRGAFTRHAKADDADEILSYRAAVFSTIGGLLFMLCWLRAGGLPLWAGATMLFIAFILFIGITRIVAEGGMAACRAPMIAPNFVVSGLGSSAVGPAGMVTLAYTYGWSGDIRTFVMASSAHALKLVEEVKFSGSRRPIFWYLASAVVITMASSCWMMLKVAYEYGGINLNAGYFRLITSIPFTYLDFYLQNPTQPNWGGWLHTAIGGGMMAALMFVRQRLLWWPLHPLGLPISATRIMDLVWFSVFLAWFVKGVVLKYGGPQLFRAFRPFFFGMILGQFISAGMWIVIDYFTGMMGNMVFVI